MTTTNLLTVNFKDGDTIERIIVGNVIEDSVGYIQYIILGGVDYNYIHKSFIKNYTVEPWE